MHCSTSSCSRCDRSEGREMRYWYRRLPLPPTAEVVAYFKASPVLVDVDAESLCMDPADAERRITAKTRAVIPVHYAGQPCDMDAIQDMAKQTWVARNRGCRSLAASIIPGVRVGAISELTAFSFYATKTLTTGEGGMVTTENDDTSRLASHDEASWHWPGCVEAIQR